MLFVPPIVPAIATLLNGGEYILFHRHQTLECWSVRRDKLFWTYDKKEPDFDVKGFDADVIDGGTSVNIVVCENGRMSNNSRLQILNLDFITGTSTALFLGECPPQSYFLRPKICGEIAFVYIAQDDGAWRGMRPTPRLINWKTRAHFELAFNVPPLSQITVLPIHNHILILTHTLSDGSGGSEILILDNSAHSSHWCDVDTHPTPNTVHTFKLETIRREEITFPNLRHLQDWWIRELCVYESPLEEGTYRVWALMTAYNPLSTDDNVVSCSYHLSLPNSGTRITWRQRTAAVSVPDTRHELAGISYSGHTVHHFRDDGHCILGPLGMTELILDETDTRTRYLLYTHISTYGGALTTVNQDRVRISYYT
ncbi:hypothetical protein MSAN_01566700 [Mycena sanguinolenta]|uniref:Uncharacterized protein n=1 Tax=Mycena sanguinolenta TaxID=230812 RepID=A0A8H6Y402_9AGAR|nr:hypothetical protein MSAN_01566700 [Mycena sanguinolenta]